MAILTSESDQENPIDAESGDGNIEANNDSNNDNDNEDKSQELLDTQEQRRARIKKIAVGLLLLTLIVFVIADSFTNQYVKDGILDFLEWIEGHPVAGVLSFIAVYFVATICFVPGSILTLGAGFVFSASFDNSLWVGVALGTCAVFVGASLGAIASFLLGRYLFRDGFVGRLTEKFKVFEALDNALRDKGLRIMVLLRLSPIVPFNVLNYIAGVTAIRFWHYVVACLGMLPGTVLYVFLGASAGSLAEIGGDGENENGDADEEDQSKTLRITFIAVGVVFGVLAVGLTSYYAKQELNRVLDADNDTAEANESSDNRAANNTERAYNNDNDNSNNNNSYGSTNEIAEVIDF